MPSIDGLTLQVKFLAEQVCMLTKKVEHLEMDAIKRAGWEESIPKPKSINAILSAAAASAAAAAAAAASSSTPKTGSFPLAAGNSARNAGNALPGQIIASAQAQRLLKGTDFTPAPKAAEDKENSVGVAGAIAIAGATVAAGAASGGGDAAGGGGDAGGISFKSGAVSASNASATTASPAVAVAASGGSIGNSDSSASAEGQSDEEYFKNEFFTARKDRSRLNKNDFLDILFYQTKKVNDKLLFPAASLPRYMWPQNEDECDYDK